uniref:UBC core domain-containing protein n=1 Tax=Panagrolaimus superbus TaxID=310955 RepID=A0A914Z297_9BILA
MACIQKLREDLTLLERLFPKEHERVRVMTSSLDEVCLRFVKPDGKYFDMSASIQENYPRVAPIWFSESEDPLVTSVLEELTENDSNPSILYQINHLVSRLCEFNQLTVPAELLQIIPNQEADEGNGSDEEIESENEDAEMSEYEDMMDDASAFEDGPAGDSEKKHDEATPAATAVLNRVAQVQRQMHLRGAATGSISANDRLMKEIREIYRSDNHKNGVYSVELVKDNLYEWDVNLMKVDDDSALASDMKQLEREKKQSYLHFRFHFKDTFPFEPPFVHLMSPTVQNGFVLSGGALCMELLTKQGWSSAYSVESLILQISATLVKGKARIAFDGKVCFYFSMI